MKKTCNTNQIFKAVMLDTYLLQFLCHVTSDVEFYHIVFFLKFIIHFLVLLRSSEATFYNVRNSNH